MKVKYVTSKQSPQKIDPLREQIVYDLLQDKINLTQMNKAIGKKHGNNCYHLVTQVVRKWAREGNLVIKKKDY